MNGRGQRFLGVDIGLTFTKASIVDEHGASLAQAEVRHQTAGDSGRSEHNPDEVWLSETRRAARAVLNASGSSHLEGICVCGPWPSVVALDEEGIRLTSGILLDDGRFDAEVEELTSYLPQPVLGYELLPRMLWFQRHCPRQWQAMRLCLSSQNYVVYRLTGNSVIDVQTAKAYGCYDSSVRGWNSEQLRVIGLGEEVLPDIRRPLEVAGWLRQDEAEELGVSAGVPVLVGTGDTFAALVTARAAKSGDDFVYCGTFGLCATLSSDIDLILDGMVTDGGHGLEWHGAMPNFGRYLDSMAALSLGRWPATADDYSELDKQLSRLPRPFSGPVLRFERTDLGMAPSQRFRPRASVEGLHMSVTGPELVMATLQEFCRQTAEAFQGVGGDADDARPIRVAGGGSRSAAWMQLLADSTGRRIAVPHVAGADGAAFLARAGTGGASLSLDRSEDSTDVWIYRPEASVSGSYRRDVLDS